jgi:Fe2+ or Zn2+ uptake regulation protein
MKSIRLQCSNCGQQKFIGASYYANGTYYVDLTCVACGDTRDIEVKKLEAFLKNIEQKNRFKNDNKKTNPK